MLQAAELLKIPKEKIKCFGASQFEIYKIKSSFSRSELIRKFDVPVSVKYILYAMLEKASERQSILNSLTMLLKIITN